MLMDGRVVALPEQERRAMRAAAAAKHAQQEAARKAQRASQGMLRTRRFLQVLLPVHYEAVHFKAAGGSS
jgi:hypothetical protein